MRIKNLKFPVHIALIYKWIEADYNNANTDAEMHELFWDWMRKSEETENKIKSICYKKSAYALFQEITGRSLESVEQNLIKLWN